MSLTLEDDFESALREALLDDVEATLIGQEGNLIHRFVQQAHDVLREYGDRHDYDVGPVIDSLGQPEVVRSGSTVTVRIGWDHPAAPFFQMGTSDHTVQGNPILSFVWEDPPRWVKKEFEREGQGYRVFLPETEPSGLPESRFVRDALNWLRREVAT